MGKESLSTVFISHGPPSLLLEDVPAKEFLKDLGKNYRGYQCSTMYICTLDDC